MPGGVEPEELQLQRAEVQRTEAHPGIIHPGAYVDICWWILNINTNILNINMQEQNGFDVEFRPGDPSLEATAIAICKVDEVKSRSSGGERFATWLTVISGTSFHLPF
eukprot:SAG31_NODE_7684_length_1615_cov_4.183136_3_plen_108_part_00